MGSRSGKNIYIDAFSQLVNHSVILAFQIFYWMQHSRGMFWVELCPIRKWTSVLLEPYKVWGPSSSSSSKWSFALKYFFLFPWLLGQGADERVQRRTLTRVTAAVRKCCPGSITCCRAVLWVLPAHPNWNTSQFAMHTCYVNVTYKYVLYNYNQ